MRSVGDAPQLSWPDGATSSVYGISLSRMHFSTYPIQAKLKIGQPNDRYEREADTMADRIMCMPVPSGEVNNMSNSGLMVQTKCSACEKEDEKIRRQPLGRNSEGNISMLQASSISNRLRQRQGDGQPLPATTNSFMSQAFGADFSAVRIHTGPQAEGMNQSLSARAFTYGKDIYFNRGEYSPGTSEGKRLLGHELTHVVQQDHGLSNHIQRACGDSAVSGATGCLESEEDVDGPRYLFVVNCDDFQRGNELDLRMDARTIQSGETVEIHGYASIEGDPDYNMLLSCARALNAKRVVLEELARRGVTATVRVFMHGATPGNRDHWRSVVVTRQAAPPERPTERERPKCGPDVTAWFVRQVNAAMRDPDVLSIRRLLRMANTVLGITSSISAQTLAEAGALSALLAQELRLNLLGSGAPARNPTINSQVAAGSVSASRVSVAARSPSILISPFGGSISAATALVGLAALKWKSLVDHGAKFDFKAHVMNHPRSAHCPDDGCVPKEVGVITFCPGSARENCYESDLPGNLFYALIGRFAGWSLLTLQLGSQFAELTDTRRTSAHPRATWDSPEDTAGINLGFGLPLPLTSTSLCSSVGPARRRLSIKTGCDDCTDRIMPPIR